MWFVLLQGSPHKLNSTVICIKWSVKITDCNLIGFFVLLQLLSSEFEWTSERQYCCSWICWGLAQGHLTYTYSRDYFWEMEMRWALSYSGASQTEGFWSLSCQGQPDYCFWFNVWHWEVRGKSSRDCGAPRLKNINWLVFEDCGPMCTLNINKNAENGECDAPIRL